MALAPLDLLRSQLGIAPGRVDQRTLFRVGVAFLASGLLHVVVWAVAGGSLLGPVSWRKPIVFGVSLAIASGTFAWVVGQMAERRWSTLAARVFAASAVVELALINLQQWRGVASHFNLATPFDGMIFGWMGTMVGVMSAVVVVWTVWLFQEPRKTGALMAARAGMVFFNVGNILGAVLVSHGFGRMAQGLIPNLVGEAGMLKVPHGVALHALQVLPLLAWWVARFSLPAEELMRRVRMGIAGYVGIFTCVLLQTMSGRAPHDLTAGDLVLGTVSVALMVAAAWPPTKRASGVMRSAETMR
jgi:hypothetical protein